MLARDKDRAKKKRAGSARACKNRLPGRSPRDLKSRSRTIEKNWSYCGGYKMLKANTAVRPNHTNPAKYAQRKAAS